MRVSNRLDLDQDRPSVGPDLGPNCLQRLSADDKSCHGSSNVLGTFRRDTAKVTFDCQTVCTLQLSYTDGSSGYSYITLFVSNSYSLDFRRDVRM